MSYSGENACVAAGCEASCCHGTFFNFSSEQYSLWLFWWQSLRGFVEVDELTFESFQMVNALTNRRVGTGTVFHTRVDSDNGTRDLVRIDGACPLLEADNSCGAWGQFEACRGLRRGSKSCTNFRQRDGLIPVASIFNE